LWTSDDVLSGDFNDDGIVNLADYTVWRDNLGTADEAAINSAGDGLPGVGVGDYAIWKSNFSQGLNSTALAQAVPEPTGLALLMLLSVTAGYQRLQSSLA
jgi:hypothetical protein